ncbi:MAG TPA: glycosyltransferase family 39 protein [bacterium]|nr:glycosyltransferase family 39 protein [bacterium]
MDDHARRDRWLVAAATALAALLRFWHIGRQSFWDDEVATFRAAGLTLRQIWTDIPLIDSNPPLIYTALHFWRALGENEFALRSLSALLGVAAVPVAYLLLRRLVGRSRAAAGALLLAIEPLAVYCGQETRYNTLVTLFCLLALWAFVELLRRPHWRWLPALAAATALAIYSHYFSFFIVAAMLVLLVLLAWRAYRDLRAAGPGLARLGMIALHSRSVRTRREALTIQAAFVHGVRAHLRGLLLALAGLALAGLAFVPFLKFFTVQLLRGVHWREPLGIVEVLRRLLVWLFVGHSVTAPPTFVAPLAKFAAARPDAYGWLLLLLVAPFVALLLLGLTGRAEHRRRGALSVLVLVPVFGVLAVSRMMPIFDPRYMLPFVPLALGATAAGWVDLWEKKKIVALLVAVYALALTGLSLKDYFYSPAHWRQDWRGLAERVAAASGPNDSVLFYNYYTSLAFLYYLERQPSPPPVRYLYVLEERFGPLDAQRRRMRELVEALAAEHRHLWLVDYHGYMDDPYDDTRRALAERGYERLSRECRLPGLWRYCLERWTADENALRAALSDTIAFGESEPASYQLLTGWYAGQGERRWMARNAAVRFRRPDKPARLHVRFFANLEFLGGPTAVTLMVDEQIVGMIELNVSQDVDWRSEPLTLTGDDPLVTVTIRSDRVFVPDQQLGDGDRSEKSLLVERIAMETTNE